AAKPWKGTIMFTPVVRNQLPRVDNSGDFAHHLSLKFDILGAPVEYVFVPQCVGSIPDCQVAYYIAWNKRDQRNEYVIPPDQLDVFVDKAAKFFVIAADWYLFNTTKYQIASSQAVYHAHQAIAQLSWDETKACLETLGVAWWDALKDPGWWAQVLPAHLPLATPKPVPMTAPELPVPPGAALRASARALAEEGAAVGAAADGAAAAPKGGGAAGGLKEGKNWFPRSGGIQQGEDIVGRGAAAGEAGAPKAAAPEVGSPKGGAPEPAPVGAKPPPQALEAMRSMETLP